MPIMEVILQQTYVGQECINRWNYLASGTPAAVTLSFALTSALGAVFDTIAVPPAYPPDGLMRLIAAAQVPQVVFDFISVRDLYSNTDFYETPFLQPLAGSATGDGMSPALAVGFRTNRTRADIRRGSKRFTGVSENHSGPGGVLAGAGVTTANAIAAKMSEILTYDDEGNTLSFAPIVMGRLKYFPNPADETKPAYRKYPTPEQQLEHIATSIIYDPYPTIRTQTSRQYGRGR